MRNEYDGWRPSEAAHAAASDGDARLLLDRVPMSQLTPRAFFDRYVAARRPVVLTGALTGAHSPWAGIDEAWTEAYLREAAADDLVRVEVRDGVDEPYGVGRYQTMRFGSFLDRFEAGDERIYLTASPAGVDAHGRPQVAAAPASRLLGLDPEGDKPPFRPPLAGNLVPANVNVWMGRSTDGATSGLHHDHHDNLYVLVRGRKRFELYSPADVTAMYTVGRPVRVHPNGRINYEESGRTGPDGDDGQLAARVAAARVAAAEAELEAAEAAAAAAAAAGEAEELERARRWVERAEAGLDEAMDTAMDGGDGRDGWEDDGDDKDDGFFGAGMRDDFDEMADDDLDQLASSDEDDDDRVARNGAKAEKARDDDEDGDPPSFSRVDRSRMESFPLFAQAQGRRVEAEVNVGEVLYLPAGWFHEVTSLSATSEGDASVMGKVKEKKRGATGGKRASSDREGGGHLALNYWFHPPVGEGNNSSAYMFETPYGSVARQKMWESDWAMWEKMFAAETAKNSGVEKEGRVKKQKK